MATTSARFVEKPWGREEIFAETPTYVGKILFIRQGEALSLQYHEVKEETLRVLDGSSISSRVLMSTISKPTVSAPGRSSISHRERCIVWSPPVIATSSRCRRIISMMSCALKTDTDAREPVHRDKSALVSVSWIEGE
jgi:hypothetical protein